MGEGIVWREAVYLILELFKETDSHLRLAVTGDKFPLSRGDATLISVVASIGGAKKNDIKKLMPYSSKPPQLYGRDTMRAHQEKLAEWFAMPQKEGEV